MVVVVEVCLWRSGRGGLVVEVRTPAGHLSPPAVLQLLGGLGACWGSVGTPGRVRKGHTCCEVCV